MFLVRELASWKCLKCWRVGNVGNVGNVDVNYYSNTTLSNSIYLKVFSGIKLKPFSK